MTMDFSKDKYLQKTITEFIEHYGTSGLEQALQLYTYMQQDYVCTTKTSVSKIKIHDIYYLEIMGHHIDVHTEYGTYQKYGSLNKELEVLLPHGFIKCNQSCIVSLHLSNGSSSPHTLQTLVSVFLLILLSSNIYPPFYYPIFKKIA